MAGFYQEEIDEKKNIYINQFMYNTKLISSKSLKNTRVIILQ